MAAEAGPLLDANVLIALVVQEHEHHVRAEQWMTSQPAITLCPIVEGSLVRYLLRVGETARTAQRVLQAWHGDPRTSFMPDDVSYADANLGTVQGHRQVTDAYLVTLAERHDVRLATLDVALAHLHPVVILLP